MSKDFIAAFNAVADEWNRTKAIRVEREPGTDIALMHSELSEALEAIRHGDPASDHIPEFKGSEEELADVVIRIIGFCGKYKLRLAEAIVAKMEFNHKRDWASEGKKF